MSKARWGCDRGSVIIPPPMRRRPAPHQPRPAKDDCPAGRIDDGEFQGQIAGHVRGPHGDVGKGDERDQGDDPETLHGGDGEWIPASAM